MKYFLIAGEASGDLHAANLMRAIRALDSSAEFRCYGGDEMAAAGGELLCHYRHLAYMGFIPVLLHARTILRGIRQCKESIAAWRPDVVVPVDYAGFNLKIARYVHERGLCPVAYFIPPKIWAWKERRIRQIRRYVDEVMCILPFEEPYYRQRWDYAPAAYVGNPTAEEVRAFVAAHPGLHRVSGTVALLPGSRLQEIRDNLPRMLRAAASSGEGYTFHVAAAPSVDERLYDGIIRSAGLSPERVVLERRSTYSLLMRAEAALVTSGTATLETALFRVPQVVCYYTACGRMVSFLRRCFLKVKYVSLVNLIADAEVVPELVAGDMTDRRLAAALHALLHDVGHRERMLAGYDRVAERIGVQSASCGAAEIVVGLARKRVRR